MPGAAAPPYSSPSPGGSQGGGGSSGSIGSDNTGGATQQPVPVIIVNEPTVRIGDDGVPAGDGSVNTAPDSGLGGS